MEENNKASCWKWLLLGLMLLGLLALMAGWFGKNNAKNLGNRARDTAQEALDKGQFGFATAELANAQMVVRGAAVDQATKAAACDAVTKSLIAKKMLGLPGLVASVKCEITAPGDEAKKEVVAATQINPVAKDAIMEDCQTQLSNAAHSGKVAFAKSGVAIESGQDVLDKVAEIAKKCAKFHIEVAGHTDSGGDDAMNMRLSQTRADMVRSYLINKGVEATQLSAKGYGETKPLVQDNAVLGVDSPERQKNRRTEFNITAQ